MGNNIEAGCLAIITRGMYSGCTVTVIKYIGTVVFFVGHNRWEIDKTVTSVLGDSINHIRESWLLRIDGGKFETEQESKEKVNEH